MRNTVVSIVSDVSISITFVKGNFMFFANSYGHVQITPVQELIAGNFFPKLFLKVPSF